MPEPNRDRLTRWPERAACLTAFAGLLVAILLGFTPHTRQNAGSDFKTLYASAWCFARGHNAYSFPELATVFGLNHVVAPASWYAHAPVYPPFTLALFAPLTLLPMVPALYLWIMLSAAAMAAAVNALCGTHDGAPLLTRPWRLLLIALAALSPLVSFGLELANVSVLVTALCLLAIARLSPGWPAAWGVAAALMLKPHLALWVLLALFFSARLADRRLARRALALATGGGLLLALAALFQPGFLQLAGYRAMLAAELGGGSMSPGNREPMEAAAQITSLRSLLGFWLPTGPLAGMLSLACLVALALVLLWASARLRPQSNPAHLTLIAAWCSFGLIATYHRAHDGMVLLLLLVPALARLRVRRRDPVAWCLLLLLAGLSVDLQQLLAPLARSGTLVQLLLYRQASLAAALLALLQAALLVRFGSRASNRHQAVGTPAESQPQPLPVHSSARVTGWAHDEVPCA